LVAEQLVHWRYCDYVPHTPEFFYGFTLGIAGGATPVPEPGSLALLGVGLAGFAMIRSRNRLSTNQI
jgi:hypothetical protein